MNAPLPREVEQAVEFTLNGAAVAAAPGETIIEVADRLGVAIPRLCYKPGMRADGNCRSCMVEINGERVLAPSCCRQPAKGMDVKSDSPRAVHAQKLIVEMLASDMPDKVYKTDSELDFWKNALGIGKPRFARRAQPAVEGHGLRALGRAQVRVTRRAGEAVGFAGRGTAAHAHG
jgi:formate dehydrogenase major subunit